MHHSAVGDLLKYRLLGVPPECLIQEGRGKIRVLDCTETWHGITYREDMDSVVSYIAALREKGVYPATLLE